MSLVSKWSESVWRASVSAQRRATRPPCGRVRVLRPASKCWPLSNPQPLSFWSDIILGIHNPTCVVVSVIFESMLYFFADVDFMFQSPNLVTPEQLKEAEAIFLDFRKINNPYQLCKEILEVSFNEYVLFETVGLLKISLVKEWSSIKTEDVQMLKNYLIQYVAHKPLPASVREKILQVNIISNNDISSIEQAFQSLFFNRF